MGIGSIIGLSGFAGVGLVVGLWLWLHRELPRTTVFLFLLAGTVFGGWLGRTLGGWIGRAIHGAGSAGATATGLGVATIVSGIAIVWALEVLWKGMSPSRRLAANTKRYHAWLALLLPTVAIASGTPLLSQIMSFFGRLGA